MPKGTPVRAARDGVVVFRESRYSKTADMSDKSNASKANIVEIEHADGEMTLYAHLQWRSVRVANGQHVRRGQIIGLSGQTGFASYPHLHFAVYSPVDLRHPVPVTHVPDFDQPLPPKAPWKHYSPDFNWVPG